MKKSYETARKIFTHFKEGASHHPELRAEIEDVFASLFRDYNTGIYENRFIVGGVVEFLIVAAFNAIPDLAATHIGKTNPRLDFEATLMGLSAPSIFSVKSSLVANGDIRLTNFLGAGTLITWDEPTIFVLPEGIAYGDSKIIPNATKRSGDALILRRRNLNEFLKSHSEYLLSLRMPSREEMISVKESRTASEDVAKQLLKKYKFLKI